MKKGGWSGQNISMSPAGIEYSLLVFDQCGHRQNPHSGKVDSRNSGSAMASPSLRLSCGLKMHRIKVDDAHGQNKVIF